MGTLSGTFSSSMRARPSSIVPPGSLKTFHPCDRSAYFKVFRWRRQNTLNGAISLYQQQEASTENLLIENSLQYDARTIYSLCYAPLKRTYTEVQSPCATYPSSEKTVKRSATFFECSFSIFFSATFKKSFHA